jgi:hypothetical protein
MMANTNRPATLILSKAAVVVALDEIVIGLKKPLVETAEDGEIAAQLRALADTVQAGRDEWVVASARKAQRASALAQRRGFWGLL